MSPEQESELVELLRKLTQKTNGGKRWDIAKWAFFLMLMGFILWTPKEIITKLGDVETKLDRLDVKVDTAFQRNDREHTVYRATSERVAQGEGGLGRVEISRLTAIAIKAAAEAQQRENRAFIQAQSKVIADKAALDASIKASILEAMKILEETKAKPQP